MTSGEDFLKEYFNDKINACKDKIIELSRKSEIDTNAIIRWSSKIEAWEEIKNDLFKEEENEWFPVKM